LGPVKKRSCRVLLCDDHEMLRVRCREMLALAPEFEIVGEADGGHAGVEMALALAPDVVVMDVDMPDLNGIEATRRILARNPAIKVLAHSAGANWQVVREMLLAGASGYMVKSGNPDELATAIRILLAGGRFLSDRIEVPIGPGFDLRPRKTLEVVLVDDASFMRDRLTLLLSNIAGVRVAGEAADLSAAAVLIQKRRPDVLILDIDLNGENGMHLLELAKRGSKKPLVIMLTNHDYLPLRRKCAELGADFYFHKATELEKVLAVCQNLARTHDIATWPDFKEKGSN